MTDLRRPFAVLVSLVRWREWYDSKLPLYLVAMCHAVPRADTARLAQLAALFVLLCLYAAFGHIINDYADRTADREAGKRKLLASWSEPAARVAIAMPCLAAILIARLCFASGTFYLTMIAVALAAVYSLPPVRLKERGLLGWAAATLAQRTLPVAIVFQACDAWDPIAIGLLVLNTLIGLRFIIVHQLRDRTNDQRAGVRTVATAADPRHLAAALRGLFACEIACACAVVAAMAYGAPLLGGAALIYTAGLAVSAWRGQPISPRGYFVFYGFYCVICPITLALPLAARNPWYLSVVCLAVVLVQRHARARFRAAFLEPIRPEPTGPATARRRPAWRRKPQPENLTISKADPYPFYARLRATAPVVSVRWPGLGSGPTWLVTRHPEALAVLKDPRFVRNPAGLTLGGVTLAQPQPRRGYGHDLAELDPPDHTRLRKLVSQAFTPRMVRRFERRIEQLADATLARARERGEIELISEYATVIPITTILELLGIPNNDLPGMLALFHTLSFDQLAGDGSDMDTIRKRFSGDLEAIFAARLAEPRDDLLTALVHAEQDGDRLSKDELNGMVYLLLLGGFVTTVNLIGNGMLALLRHPEQREMLLRDPALADTAVEELLRYDSPLELTPVCFAATDIDLDGTRVPMGAPVRVLIPSANRDESAFADADRLDLARTPNPHLSFGQGIHHCLGAPLARLEGKIALRTLLERAPNARLSERAAVGWLPHPIIRGLRQLPLRL